MRLNLRRLLVPVFSVFGSAVLAGSAMSQTAMPTSPVASQVVVSQPASSPPIVFDNSSAPNDGGFIGGLGFYVVKPYFDSNRAITQTGPVPTVVSTTDFNFNTNMAPRVWLGYVGSDGWGLRASAWFFDQDANQSASLSAAQFAATPALAFTSAFPGGLGVATPSPLLLAGKGTDLLSTHSFLRTDIIDLEITKNFEVGRSWFLVSGGARIASIENDYVASLSNSANNATTAFSSLVRNTQRFTGGGPTIAFEGHCPVGDCGLGLYGIARGALVAGASNNETNLATTSIVGGAPVAIAPSFVSMPKYSLVPMGEIELGGEWNGAEGRFRPMFRVGVIASSYGNVLNNNPATFGTNSNGSLSFLGLTVATGIRY